MSLLTSLPDASLSRTLLVVLAVGALAAMDLVDRFHHKNSHYAFACLLGTVLSAGFIKITQMLLAPGVEKNAYMMGLGVVLAIIAWRLLFGSWDAKVKATVLGSFVFWITLAMLSQEPTVERLAHMLAIVVAAVPAVAWCLIFLPYHREQFSRVLVLFFAGMIATAPIIFYDALVRHGAELQFFYFRLIPESFQTSTQTFVTSQFPGSPTVPSTLLTVFLSFLFVGLIEEASKYWVLKHGGERFFSSIDDVIEFAIIVAIGFAFAENITNSSYFLSFVRQYLLQPKPDWIGFLGNVAGRSVLTSMVHIVSTGIVGYFLGVSIFAKQRMEELKARSKRLFLNEALSGALNIDPVALFRAQMILGGLAIAAFLHAFSNFLVTLPDVLPGNPHTVAELFGLPPTSPLQYISLILLPCLLYVVGGFWLLTWLFECRENRKERGFKIDREMFVSVQEGE